MGIRQPLGTKIAGLRIGNVFFLWTWESPERFFVSPAISESLNFRLQRLFYNLQLADVELLLILLFFVLLQIGALLLSLSLYVFGMDGKEGKGFPKRTFDSELCSDFCEF
ncbi:hypothetical protein ACFX1X_044980 [Malus domestica]